MACSGAFGTPGWVRTSGLSLRRRPLYPTELRGLIQKIFNFRVQPDSNELPLRRLVLYPTELLGHISKLFNFPAQTDSNKLPLRMRPLNLSALPNRAANTCRLYKIEGNGKSTAKFGQGKQLLLYCLYYQIASMRAAVKEL